MLYDSCHISPLAIWAYHSSIQSDEYNGHVSDLDAAAIEIADERISHTLDIDRGSQEQSYCCILHLLTSEFH